MPFSGHLESQAEFLQNGCRRCCADAGRPDLKRRQYAPHHHQAQAPAQGHIEEEQQGQNQTLPRPQAEEDLTSPLFLLKPSFLIPDYLFSQILDHGAPPWVGIHPENSGGFSGAGQLSIRYRQSPQKSNGPEPAQWEPEDAPAQPVR